MIRRDDSTTTDMVITLEGDSVVTLNYFSGVQFTPGSPDAIAFLEALLDQHPSNMKRTAIKDLSNDNPDKDTDPARPSLFWSDPRGRPNDELVGQSSKYTVTWDGERYQYSCRRLR